MTPTAPPATTAVKPRIAASARPATSARYVACLALLSASALAVWLLPPILGVHLQKEAVELKKELRQFDARLMAPRYERNPATDRIPELSEDLIDSLGTREFLQIVLTDKVAPPGSATRAAKVFITYYTGQPDLVPHVPDECYLAGGFDPLGSSNEQIVVRGIGAPQDVVPVRVVEFRAPASRRSSVGDDTTAILYFFHVNGEFKTTRDGVRVALSNPFDRYAYYAKIEVVFTTYDMQRNANKEDSLEALAPLLERLMPVLYEHHMDLEKLKARAK